MMSRHPEYQYLDLLAEILDHGDQRMDRTAVGTRSIFGAMMKFNLADQRFPVMTTKRVYWQAAIKEMLWFLTGNTNIRPLVEQNVSIWSDWPLKAYREATGEEISQGEFEDRILRDPDFAERWGDLGPVYGKQWRRWLGPDGREYDQIATLIDTLRNNPSSRRMLFTGWNVAELESMALPPCHMVYQYHVTSDGKLNALLFQRSVDTLLGLPFNLIGAAALQIMLAQQADLQPGVLTWMGGDVHLYNNHVVQARTQIARDPLPFPKMSLARKPNSIDDYTFADFVLEGYESRAAIKAAVAV